MRQSSAVASLANGDTLNISLLPLPALLHPSWLFSDLTSSRASPSFVFHRRSDEGRQRAFRDAAFYIEVDFYDRSRGELSARRSCLPSFWLLSSRSDSSWVRATQQDEGSRRRFRSPAFFVAVDRGAGLSLGVDGGHSRRHAPLQIGGASPVSADGSSTADWDGGGEVARLQIGSLSEGPQVEAYAIPLTATSRRLAGAPRARLAHYRWPAPVTAVAGARQGRSGQ